MEFQVCFTVTVAKYENDMLLLCETTNVFIDAFCNSKNPFSSVRTVLIDTNNVEIFKWFVRFISSVKKSLSKG